MKPFSAACERNRQPILDHLAQLFTTPGLVLEIASGTGQHAVFFAAALPHLIWQPTDLAENLDGIRAWLAEQGSGNIQPPLVLDVDQEPWPVDHADAVFTANSLHIVSWAQVQRLFAGVGRLLAPGSLFCSYGPFHYGGQPTSESNARFDQMLRARDPLSGIRDLDDLRPLAAHHGLSLEQDNPMPANNRLLVWRKQRGVDG